MCAKSRFLEGFVVRLLQKDQLHSLHHHLFFLPFMREELLSDSAAAGVHNLRISGTDALIRRSSSAAIKMACLIRQLCEN